jgi:polysaccharide biosynthesis protein PslA
MNIEQGLDRTMLNSISAVEPARVPARNIRAVIYTLSLLLDCAALVAAYVATSMLFEYTGLMAGGRPLIIVALPIFIMFEIAQDVQSVETLSSRSLGIVRAAIALGATAIAIILVLFAMKQQEVSRVGFGVFIGLSLFGLAMTKYLVDLLVKVLLGGKPVAELLILDGAFAHPERGMDVIDVGKLSLSPTLDSPDRIEVLSRITSSYDRVVVACHPDQGETWATFLRGSDVGGEILVDHARLHGAVAIGDCQGQDTLVLSRGPLSLVSRMQKRTIDLVIGALAIVLLSPLMVVVALLIRLDSPGPVLFKQRRIGHGNRQFMMYKFRSMRTDKTDSSGSRSASRDDDRITRVGRFIRRTSIDELPQLINVIRGEMSLVGPRPHPLGSLAGDLLFWEVTHNYWLRHALKPGITGLAQIRGFRGATDREEDLEKRIRCDLEYLSNWSVWRDFLIMLQTLSVLTHKNAY